MPRSLSERLCSVSYNLIDFDRNERKCRTPPPFLNIYQKLYYMARNCGFLPQLIEYNFVKWAGK